MKTRGKESTLLVLCSCLAGLLALAATQPPDQSYLPLVSRHESAPTPTGTRAPTVTPTPTSLPIFNLIFAHDLTFVAVDGSDPQCRVGNGCTLFRIQVRNVGNRPADYVMRKTQQLPEGWGAWFCWADDCEFGDPPARTLQPGVRETMDLNFRLPLVLSDGDQGVVDVTGQCPMCSMPPFVPYQQRFRVLVALPTPTATVPGPTPTPTSTWTPTPVATPTFTPTPTSTPFVNLVFTQDLSITTISGQDASCRTGNGCTLFQIQVRNVGNRPAEYQLVKTQTIPVGWGVFFCWAADCEFGNAPPLRTLAAGARETVSINFRVPSVLFDGGAADADAAAHRDVHADADQHADAHDMTLLVLGIRSEPHADPVRRMAISFLA